MDLSRRRQRFAATALAVYASTALVSGCSLGRASQGEGAIIPLYEVGELDSLGVSESRVTINETGETVIFNVSYPTLELHQPEPGTASGAAVIVAPGGGFVALGYEEGGTAIARKLAENGVTALVLKYRTIGSSADPMRLPQVHLNEMNALIARANSGEPVELPIFTGEANAVADGARALERVRQNASTWGVDPRRVGILGLSAGAFLAINLAIGDNESRPDFVGLLYGGLRSPVPADAPPAFIAAAANDEMLSYDSVRIYCAWHEAGAPAELHMYEQGGHGFDLRAKGTTSDYWFNQFIEWMRSRGLLKSLKQN